MANQDFRVKNGLQVGLGASVVGIVTAESFSGSAVGLTSVPSSSLTGTISSERLSGTYDIDILGTVSGSTINVTTATVTEQLNVGAGDTGVFATSTDGTLSVTGIATFKDRVIFDSTNSIQIPAGTTEERGFRLLETKTGAVSAAGTDRITGINTSGIEQDQYILGPSGVLRSGTKVTSVDIGSIGIGTTALASSNGNGEFKFGTISVVAGQIRYNSELSSFEGYGPGNDWGSLGGVKDVDGDTYVKPESSPGSDEDALTFFTAGTERAVIDSNGKVGIGTTNPTATLDLDGTLNVSGISTFQNNVEIHSTGYLQIPVGFSTDRPTGAGVTLGQIRYNSELSQFEGYGAGNAWGSLGGVKDIDQDTYITAQKDLSVDDDALRFYTNGTEQVSIDSTGKVGIGSTQPIAKLDVNGTLNVSGISTFASDVDISTNLTVDGLSDLDELNVSGIATFQNDVIIENKFQTTTDGFKVLNGTSETAVISGPQNIILDPSPDDVVAIVEGDISAAGVSTITGITTTNIAVGNLIQEVDGVISAGTTVTSVGISSLTISSVSLGVATNQEFTFVNQTPTGIVRIKGDLYIDGTRTEINSTTLTVDDLNVVVASGATNGLTADTAGLTVDGANAYLKYNYNAGTNETWELNKNVGIGTDNATAKLDVVGFTELDNLNVSAASTFTSDVDFNASVDISTNLTVDGLTDLDELNVSGISTFSDDLIVGTATTGVVARTDGTLNVSGVSTFLGNVNIGTAATSVNLPGLYLKGLSDDTNLYQNPSISIGGTITSKYYDIYVVDDPNVQYVRHLANGFDYNISVPDARQFVVSNTVGSNSLLDPGVLDNEIAFKITPESSTELRYNKVKKLETTGYGVTVTGGAYVSGISTFQNNVSIAGTTTGLYFDADTDDVDLVLRPKIKIDTPTAGRYLNIYAVDDPELQYVRTYALDLDYNISVTGDRIFAISNTSGFNKIDAPGVTDGQIAFKLNPDTSTELRYNYTKKLETTGYGVTVTGGLNVSGISTFGSDLDINADVNVSGIVTAQLFSGNGGSLTNVSAFEAYKSDISERAYKTDEISGSLVYAYDGESFSNLNTGAGENHCFGVKSIISKDGKVAFVSEYDFDSQSLNSGRIHIYERTGANFTSIGIVTQTSHSSPGAAETTTCFGPIVACNADGSIFAVGSPQGNWDGGGYSAASEHLSWWHSSPGSGQQSVHIFQKNGSTITNIGILTSPSPGNVSNGEDSFGGALAFSDDGSKLYVGSPRRDVDTNGNGNGDLHGGVFVYDKSGSTYSYVGIITTSNMDDLQGLTPSMGQQLACSSDGNILFVGWPGAYRDNFNAGGSRLSGAIEIYDRSGNNFTNIGIVSSGYYSSGTVIGRDFGNEIACSDDGTYLYSISRQVGSGAEQYEQGKLHLFKRESNIYSEVSSDTLDSPVESGNYLQWSLACDSSGSKVLAGEGQFAGGAQGYVHYYARVGDNITRVGFATAGVLRDPNGINIATYGWSVDLSGSGEVGIAGAPFQTFVTTGGYGAVFFLKETRGTTVYSDILTGNIGIKSDSPKATLDVNGTLNVSGIVTAQLFSGNGGSLTNVDAVTAYSADLSTIATVADSVSGIITYLRTNDLSYADHTDPNNPPPSLDNFYGHDVTISGDGKVVFITSTPDGVDYGSVHIYERTTSGYNYIGFVTETSHSVVGAALTVKHWGEFVATNGDGSIFAVGSPQSINGPDSSNIFRSLYPLGLSSSNSDGGEQTVHIFQKNGSTIESLGIVTTGLYKGSSTIDGDYFGASLAFSKDGSRLYVGAPRRENFADFGTSHRGAVHVFDKSGSSYTHVGIITATGLVSTSGGDVGAVATDETLGFGAKIACSDDGNKIFVANPYGFTRTTQNALHLRTGWVAAYDRSGSTFTQVGIITGVNGTDSYRESRFGHGLACSSDGQYVIIGAPTEHSSGLTDPAGRLQVYKRNGNSFENYGIYISPQFLDGNQYGRIGYDIACNSDATRIITGETAYGITGSSEWGSIQTLARTGSTIIRTGVHTAPRTSDFYDSNGDQLYYLSYFGHSVDMDDSGSNLLVGAISHTIPGELSVYGGSAYIFEESRQIALHSNQATGYIGIGTDNPLVALDVAGAIKQELHTPAMPVGLNDDIGLNWTSHDELASTLEQINKFVYCGDGIVIVTGVKSVSTDASIFRSTDYGKTWIEIDFNSTNNDYNDIFSIVYCGNGIVIAGTGYNADFGDIHRSTDYGLTWSKIELDTSFESIESLEYCGNGIVLAGGSYGAGDGDIWRSTDYGASWQREYDAANDGTGLSSVSTIVYCGNGIVVAGGQVSNTGGAGLILRSTDYGDTWNIIFTTNINYMISSEYCENGIVLISGIHASAAPIYRSTDYGLTWTEVFSISASDTFRSLEYCGNGIVLAGSARDTFSSSNEDTGDMYRSVDYGKTWNLVEDFGATVNIIADILYCGNGIVLAGTGYGPTSGYIYRSEVGFSEATSLQGVYHENLTGNIGIGSTQPTAKLDINGTLNVSGVSTFQDNITVGSGKSISWDVTAPDDFYITTSSGHGLVESNGELYFGTTHLYIQKPGGSTTMAEFIQDGAVKLNHNNSTKLQTHDYGIDVTGRVETDTLNVSGIATIGNYLNIGGSDISIGSATINGDQAITFDGTAGNLFTITDNLTTGNLFAVNDVSGFSLFEVDVDGTTRMGLATNDKVGIGSAQPTAKLDVNGTLNVSGVSTFQDDVNIGTGSTVAFFDISAGRVGIGSTTPTAKLDVNGTLNVSGIATFTDNVSFGSTATFGDDDKLKFGDDGDLEIYHNGSNSVIKDGGDGDLFLLSNKFRFRNAADSALLAMFSEGDSVELYHNGNKKLETTGGGVTITGIATAQKFVGDGSELTNLPPAGSDLVTYASASNIANSAESISGISNYIQIDSLLSSQTAGAARPWRFGYDNAMSADASTLIVGAHEGTLNGIFDNIGVVYVFDREGNSYREVGILTASEYAGDLDHFGYSVACSNDGGRIIVGAYGDEVTGSESDSGVVYVFDRNPDNTFTRVGILTGSSASDEDDYFGYSVDCSGDGNVIVVGAKFDEIGATTDTGSVYVFDRSGNNFTEVGIITSSSNAASDAFGHSVSISEDGNTIVASAIGDGSNDEGIVYVFDRTGTNTFNEVGILTGGTYANQSAEFGNQVKISSNGKTIAVGCPSAEVDEAVAGTGLVHVFDRNPDNTFTRVGVLTGSHASQSSDGFGYWIDVSADGNTIAVGADSDELTGGNPIYDNDGLGYIFTRQGDTFEEVSVLSEAQRPVLSADGKTVAFGNPDFTASGGSGAGKVFIYEQQRQTYLHSTSAGNIGIGVTNPTAKLDVDGSIAIKNHSIVSITTSHTASAGTPFTIDTFATSENDLAEYTIHVGYGNTIQAQKVLVMHDGVDAYSQEYAIMHNPSKIVSIEASISGGNVLLQATPETGISGITTYKIVRGGLV